MRSVFHAAATGERRLNKLRIVGKTFKAHAKTPIQIIDSGKSKKGRIISLEKEKKILRAYF